jgi:hypothetical protein
VNNSVRDIFSSIKSSDISKYELILNCTSAVPGFEALAVDFIDSATTLGMKKLFV